MSARRLNPCIIKINRSYTVGELAMRLDVHKNTVREWQRNGLADLGGGRPTLFQGETVRAFLSKRNASRKRPCTPGTLYCFHCRVPRRPALGMADYVEDKPGTGNLQALCEVCETMMFRRVSRGAVNTVMPGIDVQISQAPSRLNGGDIPSLNCDLRGPERHEET